MKKITVGRERAQIKEEEISKRQRGITGEAENPQGIRLVNIEGEAERRRCG